MHPCETSRGHRPPLRTSALLAAGKRVGPHFSFAEGQLAHTAPSWRACCGPDAIGAPAGRRGPAARSAPSAGLRSTRSGGLGGCTGSGFLQDGARGAVHLQCRLQEGVSLGRQGPANAEQHGGEGGEFPQPLTTEAVLAIGPVHRTRRLGHGPRATLGGGLHTSRGSAVSHASTCDSQPLWPRWPQCPSAESHRRRQHRAGRRGQGGVGSAWFPKGTCAPAKPSHSQGDHVVSTLVHS